MAYEREFNVTHTLEDIYKLYVMNRMERKQEFVNKKQFKAIAYMFLKELSGMILNDGFEYKMPHKLGYMRIKTNKLKYKIANGRIVPKKGIIDWGSTRKLWAEMYPGLDISEIKKIEGKPRLFYTNDHSNGDVFRWYWDKRTSMVINHTVYTFEPVKQNRLKLKDILVIRSKFFGDN